jgi:hypothetical protein
MTEIARERRVTMSQEELEQLLEEAVFLPEGWLDDELEDAAELDKQLALEEIQGAVTLEQLEYLYARGYTIERLRELIEEAKKGE